MPARATQQFQKRHAFQSNQRFEPLPAPRGAAPYRVELADIVGAERAAAIRRAGKLVFHCLGDSGGVKHPIPQQIVALTMERDFAGAAAGQPAFLYHLGDVVYFFGLASEYYPQFYEPYAGYPAPIVAIPGNHDGDRADDAAPPSLQAFADNFCAARPHRTRAAQETDREAMTQPNAYWTLLTPFVTIIGLYTNVPEGGRVDDEQLAWFEQELTAAPKDVTLVVALHHPVFSADAHHGGSEKMGELIDAAMQTSGRVPDAVLTAHVHNYQRFVRKVGRRKIPYLVAGAGGYWHLHYMAKGNDGGTLQVPWDTPAHDATLEAYCDDRHGYLRLTATRQGLQGEYVTVPRPQESWRDGPIEVVDRFTINRGRASRGKTR